MGPLRADRGSQKRPCLLVPARSASVQASSPLAQVKVVPAQEGGHNWNWGEKILCPCTQVFKYEYEKFQS